MESVQAGLDYVLARLAGRTLLAGRSVVSVKRAFIKIATAIASVSLVPSLLRWEDDLTIPFYDSLRSRLYCLRSEHRHLFLM